MMLLLLLLGTLQNSSLEDLLRDLSSESASTRETATRRLSEGWKTWSEADLKKIEQAGRSDDSETAARVRTVFAEFALRRRIPAPVIDATPKLLQVLLAGSVDQSMELIEHVEALMRLGKVSERELIPVYIELLDDRRATSLMVEKF